MADQPRKTKSAAKASPKKQGIKKASSGAKSRPNKSDGDSDVLANIGAMSGTDRVLAEQLHSIVKACAPMLAPRLWYGMPAYSKDGKVVCFFQSAQKFKTRYATFGFMHEAKLDDGGMWPTAFALKELTAADEATIRTLVKKAIT